MDLESPTRLLWEFFLVVNCPIFDLCNSFVPLSVVQSSTFFSVKVLVNQRCHLFGKGIKLKRVQLSLIDQAISFDDENCEFWIKQRKKLFQRLLDVDQAISISRDQHFSVDVDMDRQSSFSICCDRYESTVWKSRTTLPLLLLAAFAVSAFLGFQ